MQAQELWAPIRDFPDYEISSFGNVYNRRLERPIQTSVTQHGHVKVSLRLKEPPGRFTRSVALLVLEAFVEPSNMLCDSVIVLDGNLSNVRADNLAWRPQWFAWKYTRQLKVPQKTHFYNLLIENVTTGDRYKSIIEAGMTEGLLFQDIWESTFNHKRVFPTGSQFLVIGRV